MLVYNHLGVQCTKVFYLEHTELTYQAHLLFRNASHWMQRNMISWLFFVCTALRALNCTTAENGSRFPVRQLHTTHRSAETMANRLQLGRKLVDDKTLQWWWRTISRKWIIVGFVLRYHLGVGLGVNAKNYENHIWATGKRGYFCQTPPKYKCCTIEPTFCDKSM